ncbi:MAG: hypothetical protein GY700_01675 [Propionibacteriaceae bacterium]|nr:hypothetical protein [Propionibacteriaceae bacterium]
MVGEKGKHGMRRVFSTWAFHAERKSFDLIGVIIDGKKIDLELVIRVGETFDFSILEPAYNQKRQPGLFEGKI